MEWFAETYQLETVEQLRAIADPLRLRIVDQLSHQAMTATQIGEALDLPANKVHYHVRELERVRLVRLVETREKGGILEKYYRLVAGDLQVPKALLQAVPPDESIAAASEMLQVVSEKFLRAFSQALDAKEWEPGSLALCTYEVHLTNEEMLGLTTQLQALIKPYEGREPPPDATARTVVLLANKATAAPGSAAPPAPKAAEPSHRRPRAVTVQVDFGPDNAERAVPRRVITVGAIGLGRKELEEAVASGRPLDLSVLGYLTFSGDIDAELADRAIHHIRHKGILSASPAVREVLKRKGS